MGISIDEEEAVGLPFLELVRSLMWLAAQTRPDISKVVRAAARYCASKNSHGGSANGILGA